MKLAQPTLNILFEQFQERFVMHSIEELSRRFLLIRYNESIRTELGRCIGCIGYIMLNEGEAK